MKTSIISNCVPFYFLACHFIMSAKPLVNLNSIVPFKIFNTKLNPERLYDMIWSAENLVHGHNVHQPKTNFPLIEIYWKSWNRFCSFMRSLIVSFGGLSTSWWISTNSAMNHYHPEFIWCSQFAYYYADTFIYNHYLTLAFHFSFDKIT